MPIFEYACDGCGEIVELRENDLDGQFHMDEIHGELVQCGPLRRKYTAPNLIGMPTRGPREEV